jgi:hypothetical protein
LVLAPETQPFFRFNWFPAQAFAIGKALRPKRRPTAVRAAQ